MAAKAVATRQRFTTGEFIHTSLSFPLSLCLTDPALL